MGADECVIRLERLALEASIGIYPHELAARQTLLVDLTLCIDGAASGRSDDIRHTVDYDEVVACLEALIAARHFNLLEHLSQVMLDTLGERFAIRRLEVSIAKPAAVPGARRVSVSRMAVWPAAVATKVPAVRAAA